MTVINNIHWVAQLFLGEYSIDVFNGTFDSNILRLFQKSSISIQGRNSIKHNFYLPTLYPNGIVRGNNLVKVEIKNCELISRMNYMGYSIVGAQAAFQKTKEILIQNEEHDNLNQISPSFPDQDAFYTKSDKIDYFSKLNFKDFLAGINEVISNLYCREILIEGKIVRSIAPREINSTLARYIVLNGFTALPFTDRILYLRCILEAVDKNLQIQYIIDGLGVNMEINILKQYFERNNVGLKTLILTEGDYDVYFLQSALEKLYPELADLYYFFDFKIKSGGVTSLVHNAKALAASNISNNIICLFDNDSAGVENFNILRKETNKFPKNIYVKLLPDIELANNYPVELASDQIEYINVNKIGCAIEMYLGKELLMNSYGGFIPLNRTSNKNQYQFSNGHKTAIKQKFKQKLNKPINRSEWEEMDLILKSIIYL